MRKRVKEIQCCRISGSKNLVSVLNLGVQKLTGVFPSTTTEELTEGPLELVWCPESGLVQMKHSYDLEEMYGMNYGYRSGLNKSMVDHLKQKIQYLQRLRSLTKGDVVIDIGSNDATTLKAYTVPGITRIGIDPTGKKFREYYTDDIQLIPDFFSAAAYHLIAKQKKAKIITSISMFYDLEDPAKFVRDIAEVLAPDGIWHFEQSYLPSMLRTTSYDTVCHEHIEYYSLQPVVKLLKACGMKVLDVQMNSINGGSFAVSACHADAPLHINHAVINWLLEQEERMGLDTIKPFQDFAKRVFEHRNSLISLIRALNASGKKVFGYGASTKGNVLLQFCGLGAKDLPCIAEVNQDKFGKFTPGTNIPIISEEEAKAKNPDYFLVMPWHFKNNILQREQEYLQKGGKMIFPLPEIEIIGG
jgi:hypothetical protein